MQGIYKETGAIIEHTPASKVEAGDVIELGAGTPDVLLGVATQPIEANELGSLRIQGTFDFDKTTDAFAVGQRCYWDNNGSAVRTLSTTGAMTTTGANGIFVGMCIRAATAADERVRVRLMTPTDAIA